MANASRNEKRDGDTVYSKSTILITDDKIRATSRTTIVPRVIPGVAPEVILTMRCASISARLVIPVLKGRVKIEERKNLKNQMRKHFAWFVVPVLKGNVKNFNLKLR